MGHLPAGLESIRPEEEWFLDSVANDTINVGGKDYPWYIAPFTYLGKQYDLFGEPYNALKSGENDERARYDRIRAGIKAFSYGDRGGKLRQSNDDEVAELCRMSPAYFIHKYFFIRDKRSRVALFDHWNLLQRHAYYDFIIQLKTSLIGVRIDLLKSRQEGGSSLAMALICAVLFLNEDKEALEMSNKDANAKRIYAMAERFFRLLREKSTFPKRYIPLRQNHSGLKLVLGNPRRTFLNNPAKTKNACSAPVEEGTVLNSALEVLTAATSFSDVGFTATLLHLTELALWPNAAETWENMSPGLADVPGSVAIRESVAWIAEDWWHSQIRMDLAGESDFHLIFSGWNEHPYRWNSVDLKWENEYRTELPGKYQGVDGKKKFDLELPKRITDWRFEYRLSDEQCYWAWRGWATKCNRDWDRFCRQYPLSVDMAFRFTGTGFFNPDSCKYYLDVTNPSKHPAPEWQGDLLFDTSGQVVENHREDGYLSVWKRPVPGRCYVASVDGAEGQNPDGDFSVTDILDVESCEQVAQLMFKLENPRYHAFQVRALDAYYGQIFWVPECHGSAGYAITEYIQPAGEFPVQHLYIRESILNTDDPITTKWGYAMGGANAKFSMLAKAREEVNAAPAAPVYTLHSYATATQLSSYCRRPDGTYGNAKHKKGYDDCVISLGLITIGLQSEQRLSVQGRQSGIVLKNFKTWQAEDLARLGQQAADRTLPTCFADRLRLSQAQPARSRFVSRVPYELLDDVEVIHPELGTQHG